MDIPARHHLAVIAGPDCGLIVPVLPGGAVVGRGGQGQDEGVSEPGHAESGHAASGHAGPGSPGEPGNSDEPGPSPAPSHAESASPLETGRAERVRPHSPSRPGEPGSADGRDRAAQPAGPGRGPDLTLVDRYLSRRHLQARERHATVRVRDLGSANGTRIRLARGRSGRLSRRTRRLGRRWRHLPEGSRILAGETVLELRRHPGMVTATEPEESGSIGEGLMGRLMLPLIMSVTTLPLLLRGGGMWRLVLMIALPVVLVAAILWPALRQRARRLRRAATGAEEPDRPRTPQPFTDPAALLAGAGAPVQLPEDGLSWEVGDANTDAPRPRRRHTARRPGGLLRGRAAARATRMRWVAMPAPGSAVALVGDPEPVAELGRWLAVRHAVATGEPVRSRVPDLAVLDGSAAGDATAGQSSSGESAARRLPAGQASGEQGPSGQASSRQAPSGQGSAGTKPAASNSADDSGPALRLWHAGRDEVPVGERDRDRHLVLAERMSDLPRWCSTVIDVRTDHNRRVQPGWTHAVVTALPDHATRATVPEQVHLEQLLPRDLRAWTEPTMLAPLGVGAHGPVELDLAEHGPHALVAGTTGAGKSELLTAWIMGLAHHAAPADVSFVLFDYKGGATFAPLAQLEHVVGVLTDLDESITARALRSLQAELRAREHALAAVGAHDIGEQRRRTRGPDRLGRLVVVVDEFRVMADAHPEQLDALVRLAAQGRSLGIHLILATQRPGGAITPDMRANLTLRLCLRVLEENDAMDMLGDTSAARLPRIPGRAILRAESAWTVQTPWCGPAAKGWVAQRVHELNRGASDLARAQPWRRRRHRPWAPPLPQLCWAADLLAGGGSNDDPVGEPGGGFGSIGGAGEVAEPLVDSTNKAAAPVSSSGEAAAPVTGSSGEIHTHADAGATSGSGATRADAGAGSRDRVLGYFAAADGPPGDSAAEMGAGSYGLPWLVVDLPDEQRLGTWWPPAGTTLISGGPGSGRTSALQCLAESALRAGTPVHVLAEGAEDWPGARAPSAGTWCGTDDPRRARRLLQLLLSTPAPGLVLIDDADSVGESLDEVGPWGEGAELLLTLVRRARRLGVDVVLSADERSRRWAAGVGRHLLLCPRDPADAVMAGAPKELVGSGWPPGRGVLLERGRATVAQVALAQPDRDLWREPVAAPLHLVRLPREVVLDRDGYAPMAQARPGEGSGHDGAGSGGNSGHPSAGSSGSSSHDGAGSGKAVPHHDGAKSHEAVSGQDAAGPGAAVSGQVLLGRGGDAAQWVSRSLRPGQTWLVCGPGGSGRTTALAAMVHQVQQQGWNVLRPTDLPVEPIDGPSVLVVDDADRLASATVDACVAHLHQGEPSARAAVLAAARSDGLVTAHHPLAVRLREAEVTVALTDPRPAHLPSVDLREEQDPLPPPGRGVLIDSRYTVPIQLARLEEATRETEALQHAVGLTAGTGGGQ